MQVWIYIITQIGAAPARPMDKRLRRNASATGSSGKLMWFVQKLTFSSKRKAQKLKLRRRHVKCECSSFLLLVVLHLRRRSPATRQVDIR